jgi:hypothetical protein
VSINDDGNNTSYYVYILIHTINAEYRPTMKANIYNQCSNFKLTHRGRFSTGADWNEEPAWEIDAGSMMSVDLTPFRVAFNGVLIYVLQRKDIKPSNRLDPTHIRLFVVWKSVGYKKFCVFVQLMECDRQTDWNILMLKEYYQRYTNQLCTYTGPIEDTWLIYDGTAPMTRLDWILYKEMVY